MAKEDFFQSHGSSTPSLVEVLERKINSKILRAFRETSNSGYELNGAESYADFYEIWESSLQDEDRMLDCKDLEEDRHENIDEVVFEFPEFQLTGWYAQVENESIKLKVMQISGYIKKTVITFLKPFLIVFKP